MANENRYYKTPFAESGDKTEVPNVSTGGAVGYDTGFGPDYELPQGTVNRKRIERDMWNGLQNGVTGNLKQWQENLYPTWIEDNGDGVAFSYSEGMIVSHNNVDYVSLEGANQEEPGTGSKWSVKVSSENDISKAFVFPNIAAMKDSTITFPVGKPLHVIDVKADYTVTAGSSPNLGSPALIGGGYAALIQVGEIIASHWGVVPSGIVDITTFKAMVAYSTTTETNIQYRSGTYNFNNQDITDGGLVRGQDIGHKNDIGGFGGTTIFANIGSAHYSNVIFSRDIHYQDCVQPVYFTGAISKVDIDFCDFSGCLRSIYHNDSAAGASYDNVSINDNIFRDSLFDDFTGCILFHRAPTGKNVSVRRNKFINIQTDPIGTNIVLLCQFGVDTATAVDDYLNNRFIDNYITGCGNPAATYPGSPSFSCVIIGQDNWQDDNEVIDNFWLEGMYTKGNGNSQDGNKIRNSQFNGISQKVVAITNASKNNTQTNTIVEGQCDIRAAVRLFGSGRSTGSQVNITTTSQVDNQGGLAFQTTRSTSIGEMYVSGNFVAPKGIQLNTAGDVTLDVRLVSESNGVEVIKSTDGNLGVVSMSGTINCVGAAVNVNWCEDFIIDGSLDVKCNRSDGNSVFLYTQNKTDISGLSLHVTDVSNNNLPITTPVGLFARDGGPLNSHTTIADNFNFVTDRNFTEVIRYNADPILSSNMQGKVIFSDLSVDMNSHTGSNFIRTTSNLKKLIMNNVNVDGSLNSIQGTVNGNGLTIGKLIINNCLLDYITTDTALGHTNATVISSRVVNNKTS